MATESFTADCLGITLRVKRWLQKRRWLAFSPQSEASITVTEKVSRLFIANGTWIELEKSLHGKRKIPWRLFITQLNFVFLQSYIKLINNCYSLNKSVLRYFSPRSGKITTIRPESIFLATSVAAYIAAPLLIPTKIPSFLTIWRA